MSAVLTRRESLPQTEEPGAVTGCAACGETIMLIARETPDTAQVECTACGVSLRIAFIEGAARLLNLLPRFQLTHRASRAAPPQRSRAELYRLFGLTPPA